MEWGNNIFSRLRQSITKNRWFWLCSSTIIGAVIVALILYYNITLNFTILGLLIILIWLLVFGGYTTFQNRSRRPRTNGMFVTGKENAEFAMISGLSLLIIGVLSVYTIDNYFYPEEQVYRNIDHHVVRLDGAKIVNPRNFVLAANSPSAFLDSKTMNGKISISNYSDSSAISFRLEHCTRALYSNLYSGQKRCWKRNLLNKDQLLHFDDGGKGDTLFLRLSNGQELKFFTQICKDVGFFKTPIHVPFFNRDLIFRHRKDSAIYSIQFGDSIYYSDEHRILTTGLALNDLLKGVTLPDIDLSGIHIVRPAIYPTLLRDSIVFKYDSIGYNVEYVGGVDVGALTTVTHIRSHSEDNWRSLKTNQSQTVEVPYGISVSLGSPLNSNQHIYFTKDSSENIYINYRQPKRAYLPGEVKDKKFNSVYVATSLAGDAEKLQFVPEQIILFDEFEKFKNGNNITPFTLSYIAGPTTQNLELIAKTESGMDTLLMNHNPVLPIEGIQSLNGKLQWNIGIENLKETTPCKIGYIKRNIILLSVVFAFLILFGAVRFFFDSEDKEKRNTFTFAEFIIYSTILYLLTFRWLLIWRTSVFLPTSEVSYYEYETLFRGMDNMQKLNLTLTAFIIVVFLTKIILMPATQTLIISVWSFIKEKIIIPIWSFIYDKLKLRVFIEKIVKTWNNCSDWLSQFASHMSQSVPIVRLKHMRQQVKVLLGQFRHVVSHRIPHKIKLWLKKWGRRIKRGISFTYRSTPAWCVIIFLIVIPVSFAFRSSPAVSITIAVLGYIISVAICNAKLLGHYKLEDQQCDCLSPSHPVANYLWAVILNTLFYSVILYVLDSGYAILFITFCVFYLIWLLHEYVTCYMSDEAYHKKRDWWVLFLFLGFIVLLCCYRQLFNFLLNYNIWIIGSVFAIVTCVVLGVACYGILNIKFAKKSIALIATCACIIGLAGMGFKDSIPKYAAHTTARITVHFADPVDVMGTKETESDMQKYMEAALNHMIIGEYEERGHDVKVFGEQSKGYFKMQPQSKIGALWNAQLTDISLVRYCIAEHGIWLPFCFMLAFIIMLFTSVRMPLYHRWARTILILVPLLFTVQSLLIWMANTQRFIFLGQDFPLVSVNSRLTLTFFFGLTLLWIAVLLYERVHFYQVYEDNDDAYDLRLDNDWRYEVARRDSLKVGFIMIISLMVCTSVHHLVTKPDKTFEVNELMKEVQNEINQTINPLLVEYQKKYGQISLLHPNIHNRIADFDREMNVEQCIQSSSSNSKCSKLVLNLWRNYVEKGSIKNTSSLVMHARLVKDTIHIEDREQDKDSVQTIKVAKIIVRQKYYDKELPKRDEDFWKGSFVTRLYDKTQLLTAQYGPAKTYTLPNEWLEESNSAVIVNNHRGKYGVTVAQGDNVAYLARNVRVNGKPMYIYPLEEKFYWIRNFTDQIANQKNKLRIEDRGEDYNSNVEMTISAGLTRSLYAYLSSSRIEQPSVMVANGDGDVVAMVSYDKNYHLNPNDIRTISSLYDSLYINGLNGDPIELRAFANKNLVHMHGGPGSSQKPLLWTAVASAIEFPWADLTIAPYYGKIDEADKSHFRIKKFNNLEFRKRGKGEGRYFYVLKVDERNGNQVNLSDFMTYSSNVYNAVMAYIGSFSDPEAIRNIKEISEKKDSSHIFAYSVRRNEVGKMKVEQFRNEFPFLYMGGNSNSRLFTFDKLPDMEHQENSILERQMNKLFLSDKYCTNKRKNLSSTAGFNMRLDSIINGFAYCEQTSLYNRGQKNAKDFAENAIRFTAIGGEAVWNITPWKMAESYGRMTSWNKNYTLSVIKNPQPTYLPFDSPSAAYESARNKQMEGMGKVFTEGTASGKEKSGNKRTGLRLGMIKSNKIGEYYLYAKTGTTNDNQGKQYHRFGVMITNKDLANTSLENLKHVKYYIMYFAVDLGTGNNWKLYADCIKEVMNSDEFKKYMKQE